MLIFPIKAHWFKMIERGEKLEEYREDTPYYRARLERFEGEEIECILRNGYSAASPQLKIKAVVEYGQGREEWGAERGKMYLLFFLNFSACFAASGNRFLISAA